MSEIERLVKFFRCEFEDCHHEWQPKPQWGGRQPEYCPRCGRTGWYEGKKPKYKPFGPKRVKAKPVPKLTGSQVLAQLRGENAAVSS